MFFILNSISLCRVPWSVQVAAGGSSSLLLLLPPRLCLAPPGPSLISPVAAQRQPGVGWLVVGQTRESEDVISEVRVITEQNIKTPSHPTSN